MSGPGKELVRIKGNGMASTNKYENSLQEGRELTSLARASGIGKTSVVHALAAGRAYILHPQLFHQLLCKRVDVGQHSGMESP